MPFLPPNQQRQSTEGTALKAQVNLIMRAKKIVNQSSDFLVRRTGSYRHKKSTACITMTLNSLHDIFETDYCVSLTELENRTSTAQVFCTDICFFYISGA